MPPSPGGLEKGRCQTVLKNQTPIFFYLPPRQRPDRGEHRPHTPKKASHGHKQGCMLVLMFLRTRKQKSKIDFALLDKSNKMVSGVKLILTKQNPRRLNRDWRLCKEKNPQ